MDNKPTRLSSVWNGVLPKNAAAYNPDKAQLQQQWQAQKAIDQARDDQASRTASANDSLARGRITLAQYYALQKAGQIQ